MAGEVGGATLAYLPATHVGGVIPVRGARHDRGGQAAADYLDEAGRSVRCAPGAAVLAARVIGVVRVDGGPADGGALREFDAFGARGVYGVRGRGGEVVG